MIRKIRNLGTLEEAFGKGLKKEDAISLIIENISSNGIIIGKTEYNKELFLTTVEENQGMIERRLYKIEKNGIHYMGPLDAEPEDAERIVKLKNALFNEYHMEGKK